MTNASMKFVISKYNVRFFINIACSYVHQAGELMECTGDEYLPWVAQYLVMKRASIEHNFHTLYANFIDHLKKADFLNMVISETYRNIKVCIPLHYGRSVN